MKDLHARNKKLLAQAFVEWIVWIVGSLFLVLFVKWATAQYGAPQVEMHIWISATLYLWYVSTMSILVGGTYFMARSAQSHLERRNEHPQKPQNVDLSKDIQRVQRIKRRAAVVALVVHSLNAVLVYFVSRHIPGITPEFQLYAVVGVFAVAAIKPGFTALTALRAEILGMQNEADYPMKTVAELWRRVDAFGDYEKRLTNTFEQIDHARQAHEKHLAEQLRNLEHQLQQYRTQLHEAFEDELAAFRQSDRDRQTAYNQLKEAQVPVLKELGKVLGSIQSLKDFVIELRDKNIKGEQLMSALKEFGIESLADLQVSFRKQVADRNPPLKDETQR